MPARKRRAEAYDKIRKQTAAVDTIKTEAKTRSFIEKVCGEHKKQLEFVQACLVTGARVAACGGRQSGKSRGAFAAAVELLGRAPDQQALWIGLSAEAVRTTTWPSIKRYLREWGLLDNPAPDAPPQVTITEKSPTAITFPNNSRLVLLGTDDAKHIESFRGGTNALIVLDEIQSQPYEIIQGFCDEILEPSLVVSDGPLIVLGTPPRKRVGWFAETWFRGAYRRFSFTGADNPAMASRFQAHVERIAADRGVDWRTDPRIRREWFGEWRDDVQNAVLPNFSATRNLYTPAVINEKPTHVTHAYGFHVLMGTTGPAGLPRGRWLFSMGIDTGQRDRLAIEVLGWCDTDPRVWQVAEWCAPRGHRSPASVWVPYVKELLALYGNMPIYVDPSGISVETLQIDYHLDTAKGAIKARREDQCARLNDLCAKAWLQIVDGSKLAEDCIKAEWAPQKGTDGQRAYSTAWKIDPLDAARYGLAGYWDVSKPVDTRTNNEIVKEALHDEFIRSILEQGPETSLNSEIDTAFGFSRA